MSLVVYIISVLVHGLIFGLVTKTMNQNKGYEGGFWWGFFLGLIGVIVIACKRDNVSYRETNNYSSDYPTNNSPERIPVVTVREDEKKTAENNDKSTLETLEKLRAQGVLSDDEYEKKSIELRIEPKYREQIKSLSQLFENGILTAEEYEAKKKDILELAKSSLAKKEKLQNLVASYRSGALTKDEYMRERRLIVGEEEKDIASILLTMMPSLEGCNTSAELKAQLEAIPGDTESPEFEAIMKTIENTAKFEKCYGGNAKSVVQRLRKFADSGIFVYIDSNGDHYKCPTCGSAINEDVGICAHCGTLWMVK